MDKIDPVAHRLRATEHLSVADQLAARFGGVAAGWEALIGAQSRPGAQGTGVAAKLASDFDALVAQLTAERATVEQDVSLLRQSLTDEETFMAHWETTAMAAVTAGRDDLAKRALERHSVHRTAAESYHRDLAALEIIAAEYRSAIESLHARRPLPPASSG